MIHVLDSWALLAWMQKEEPACRRVRSLLNRAARGRLDLAISMINAGEIFYLLSRRGQPERAEEFTAALGVSIPVRTVVPDRDLILDAARLKARYPISYADAFAAATAFRLKAPLVTGDPEFRCLKGVLRLIWLGVARPARSGRQTPTPHIHPHLAQSARMKA